MAGAAGWVWWEKRGRYLWAARDSGAHLRGDRQVVTALCATEEGANALIAALLSSKKNKGRVFAWELFGFGKGDWSRFKWRAVESVGDPSSDVRRRALFSLLGRARRGDIPDVGSPYEGLSSEEFWHRKQNAPHWASKEEQRRYWELEGSERAEWVYAQLRRILFTEPEQQLAVLQHFGTAAFRGNVSEEEYAEKDRQYLQDLAYAIRFCDMSREAKLDILSPQGFWTGIEGVGIVIPLLDDPDEEVSTKAALLIISAMGGERLVTLKDQEGALNDSGKRKALLDAKLERFVDILKAQGWPLPAE